MRWQEDVSGAAIAVGMSAAGTVRKAKSKKKNRLVEGSKAYEGADVGFGASEVSPESSGEFLEADEAINSWGQLAELRNRQPVTIGLGLCVLAAFSGSNTIIYYASTVLREAGLTNPGLLTWAVGVPNLLGGIIALVATDKYGRRPLLLLSFGGMAACLGALSFAAAITPGTTSGSFCDVFLPEATSGLPCVTCSSIAAICSDLQLQPIADSASSVEPIRTVALVTIPAYTLLFSLGAGPVPWLLYNEVFPTRIRARATGVCTAINYAANTVVGASFLPMVSSIGLKGTYALYAVLCFVGFLFVDAFVFETKGLALQDVEGVMAAREQTWKLKGGDRSGGDSSNPSLDQSHASVGAGFLSEVRLKMERLMADTTRKVNGPGESEVGAGVEPKGDDEVPESRRKDPER